MGKSLLRAYRLKWYFHSIAENIISQESLFVNYTSNHS